jgi:cystathionine beta-lyase/cystathionine gamma-synthase
MTTFQASSHRTPIYRDAGFTFQDIAEAEEAFSQEATRPQSSPNFIYTRYGNPTVRATEEILTALENCQWTLLTASGMSAIDTALSVFQDGENTGTWLFFSELYGGTNIYINQVLIKRRGIHVERFAPQGEVYDLGDFVRMLDEVKPTLLFLESISNPLLIVPNAQEMLSIAKARNIKVIVDNTFGTPMLWQPLKDGADIVVHSATKYLSGHGNLTGGVLCGDDGTLRDEALRYRKFVGCILSPDDAYRLQTQVATLELRFMRQCANAYLMSKALDKHGKVARVLYPGLESHATFKQAATLFGDKGSGAMVTFELQGGRKACDTFVASVRDSIRYIPTLGDINSILLHVSTVFGDKYPDGMIRFSVGCEPYEHLERAVLSALEVV